MERFSVFLLFLVAAVLAEDLPIVDTIYGKVIGCTSTSRSGRRFFSFNSIPFSKPPMGQLRFKPPQEPETWSGVKNTTDDGPMCINYNLFAVKPKVLGTEDCLYLSVHTHDIKGSAPVMFYIHGGGFIAGDKSKQRPNYLMDEDVVIVQTNYRLGIMGFLSFEDEEQPGNQGMKDQVMALKWVKKNIGNFGGNPERVTIVGDSAGGASVIHHIISPLSQGLYHGAIAESGSSYNTWALLPPGLARKRFQKLAGLVSCPLSSTKEAVLCMQNVDAIELVSRMEDFREWQIDPLMLLFQPVVERKGPEAFLSDPPSKWRHNHVPLLIGGTSGEGFLRTFYFQAYDMDYKWYNDNFEKIAPTSLQYFASASDPDDITKKIREYYFRDKEITKELFINLTNAYTDSWFLAGIFEAANKHPGDVYFYYFDYIGEYGYFKKNKSLLVGAGHTDEMFYLFERNKPLNLEGDDLELSKTLIKIWTDFAKYGKGISPERDQVWKTWTPKQHDYLSIKNDGFKSDIWLQTGRYQFWNYLNYKDNYELNYTSP